jgi:hypothetical protein
MNPQPLRKLEISEIHASLKGALFMQHDRGYVPEWMVIHGWTVGISLKEVTGRPEIVVELQWSDKRGRLMRGGRAMDLGRSGTIWGEKDWICGLEGLVKMTIKEWAKRWVGWVEHQMLLGAYWENATAQATPTPTDQD